MGGSKWGISIDVLVNKCADMPPGWLKSDALRQCLSKINLVAQHNLVAQEVLGRHRDNQLHVGFYHALASQAGVDARVFGAVNKVLFFVADFGQVAAARVDVDVAGAAAAYPAAVVLQLDAVVEGHVENRLAGGRHVGLDRLAVAELEGDGGGRNRQNEKQKGRKKRNI